MIVESEDMHMPIFERQHDRWSDDPYCRQQTNMPLVATVSPGPGDRRWAYHRHRGGSIADWHVQYTVSHGGIHGGQPALSLAVHLPSTQRGMDHHPAPPPLIPASFEIEEESLADLLQMHRQQHSLTLSSETHLPISNEVAVDDDDDDDDPFEPVSLLAYKKSADMPEEQLPWVPAPASPNRLQDMWSDYEPLAMATPTRKTKVSFETPPGPAFTSDIDIMEKERRRVSSVAEASVEAHENKLRGSDAVVPNLESEAVRNIEDSSDSREPSVVSANGDADDEASTEGDDANDEAMFGVVPLIKLQNLKDLMAKTKASHKALTDWDKKQGLPKSHSWTMMHTARSRRQIIENRILLKWDGKTPLIQVQGEEMESHRKKHRKTSHDKNNNEKQSNSRPGDICEEERTEREEQPF